ARLTVDHTRGQQLRTALAARYHGRRAELEELAQAQDHVVTRSIGSATPGTIGHVTTRGPRHRLILTGDGVHKPVPHRSIIRAARMFSDSPTCAHKLTFAARF